MAQLTFDHPRFDTDPDYWFGVDRFIAPSDYEAGVDAIVDAATRYTYGFPDEEKSKGLSEAMRRGVRIGIGRAQVGIIPMVEDHVMLSGDLLGESVPDLRRSMTARILVANCIMDGVNWAETGEVPAVRVAPGLKQPQLF